MIQEKICLVGLGYVGLPLAMEFSRHFNTVGYDVSSKRIESLQKGKDENGEIATEELASLGNKLSFSDNIKDASDASVYILTIPTPLDQNKKPDLSLLKDACEKVSSVLSSGDLIIIESTVYPGTTENFCLPILEKSGLRGGKDFDCGYSPERVRPSSPWKNPANIVKVISGQTPHARLRIKNLYSLIIKAGVFEVSSIPVAEMSKLYENIQRDVNIAVVNELSIICEKLRISAHEMLAAANTKWDIQKFTPGLVGGHCIGIDPYYLIQCAETLNSSTDLIKTARKVNDNMGYFIAGKTLNLLQGKKNASILILGLAFKENCKDIRNTRIIDIYDYLRERDCDVLVCDPLIPPSLAKKRFPSLPFSQDLNKVLENTYDAVIFGVAHEPFKEIKKASLGNAVVIDVKGILADSDWCL